jgi:hypothetical protein
MDHVSRTAIEGNFASVGWEAIFVFSIAIALLVCIAMRSSTSPRSLRKHPRPFPPDDRSPSTSSTSSSSGRSSGADQSAEVSPAATVGSDYYVPTSDELKGEIKEHILNRQKRDALQLSRELVNEYRRLLESGEAKDIYCVIANPLLDDYTIRDLCGTILLSRGWSASWNGSGSVFFGPIGVGPRCSFSPADINTIPDSQSLAELIESNIIAPRKALALRVAKELVDGYRLKLEAEQPTSEGITVTLAERIDYDVLIAVENILAPRGWSVTQREGSSYSLWPTEKRDKPYRGGPFMLL